MADFLFEIGTEELPAGYISPALDFMASFIGKLFEDKRIKFETIEKYSTPRRLAVIVKNVAKKQLEAVTEMIGPPEKVAFKSGKPGIPAVKFAEKLGVSVDAVEIRETEKGRYLFGKRVEETLATKDILKEFLPDLVKKIPFRKSMRWADYDISFARPLKGFVAILDDELIEFDIEGIKSSKFTFGHRFHCNEKVEIPSPSVYLTNLEKAFVLSDHKKRKDLIKSGIEKAAEAKDGRIYPDDELLSEVINLVEYPVVLTGKFDDEFLNLPDEVLYTAMKKHQKYFAILDNEGSMMPYFITIANIVPKDDNVVINGNERVLRARLSDADFFFKADSDSSFEEWNKELFNVMFHAELGSLGEKVERIVNNSSFIADKLGLDLAEREAVLSCAKLCKADLVSQMVGEFANLQGIMGRIYAGDKGMSSNVAKGIEEHYMPVAAGAALPETITGIIASIADKLDSISGCFSIGLAPTGATDPYALRRQCIGILNILKNKNISVSLDDMILYSLSQFKNHMKKSEDEIFMEIKDFFNVRLEQILVDEGFHRDLVASVISVGSDNISYVCERVEALSQLKKEKDFEPLAKGFKRVGNILKKSEIDIKDNLKSDPALFEMDEEKALYNKFKEVNENVSGLVLDAKIKEALFAVASLREEVDSFFDNVMVMDERAIVRNNRIALLSEIAGLFGQFADFSRISA